MLSRDSFRSNVHIKISFYFYSIRQSTAFIDTHAVGITNKCRNIAVIAAHQAAGTSAHPHCQPMKKTFKRIKESILELKT